MPLQDHIVGLLGAEEGRDEEAERQWLSLVQAWDRSAARPLPRVLLNVAVHMMPAAMLGRVVRASGLPNACQMCSTA